MVKGGKEKIRRKVNIKKEEHRTRKKGRQEEKEA